MFNGALSVESQIISENAGTEAIRPVNSRIVKLNMPDSARRMKRTVGALFGLQKNRQKPFCSASQSSAIHPNLTINGELQEVLVLTRT